MVSRTVNKREKYVDVGKGIAIIAIVCHHISTTIFPWNLFDFWPVVFFFVVAGFYLKEDTLLKPVGFILHKLRTLYLPGTIIYLLAVLLHNPFCRWGVYPMGGVHPYTRQPFVLWNGKTYLYNILKTIVAPNGELAMGAMWFLYALFFSLCFISIIAYCSNKIGKRHPVSDPWLYAIVFLISTLSLVMAGYGIKIPRISLSLVIMPFILGGFFIKQKLKPAFNNWALFILFLVVYIQCIIIPHSEMSFPLLVLPDIVLPLIMGVSAVYVVLFVSKYLEKVRHLSDFLSYVGQNSLYIMALHICGFFLCTKAIDLMGLNGNLAMSGSLYTYSTGGSIGLFFLYLFFGITFPLVCVYIYRKTATMVKTIAGKMSGN